MFWRNSFGIWFIPLQAMYDKSIQSTIYSQCIQQTGNVENREKHFGIFLIVLRKYGENRWMHDVWWNRKMRKQNEVEVDPGNWQRRCEGPYFGWKFLKFNPSLKVENCRLIYFTRIWIYLESYWLVFSKEEN